MTVIGAQVGDPFTFGTRLPLLRKLAGGIGQEALSLEIGERKGMVTWYEALNAGNAPKSVNAEHAWQLASALAGRGRLVDDVDALFRFLLGIDNDARAIDQGVLKNNNHRGLTELLRFPTFSLRRSVVSVLV